MTIHKNREPTTDNRAVMVTNPRPDRGLVSVGYLGVEQVEDHIGTQLIHRSRFACATEGAGGSVDAGADAGGPIEGKIQQIQMSGPIGARFQHHSPLIDRFSVAVGGVVGIDLDPHLLDRRRQLARGQLRCLFQHPIGHLSCLTTVRWSV